MKVTQRYGLVFALTFGTLWLNAGGIALSRVSVNGHGLSNDGTKGDSILTLLPEEPMHICFNLEGYTYSGHRYESAYVVFELRKLPASGGARSLFFKKFDRVTGGDVGFGENHRDFELQHCVDVDGPKPQGLYELRYSHVLLFPSDFHVDEYHFTSSSQQHFLALHQSRYASMVAALCRIRVGNAAAEPRLPSTYIQLNGSTPLVGAQISPGVGRPPVVFSWFVKPAPPNVQYRYRLYPTDTDWSPWNKGVEATYFYLPAGSHQFQVDTRFQLAPGSWEAGEQAQFQFFLEAPLIAKPIVKARSQTVGARSSKDDFASIYSRSRALVIGVTQYQDASFAALPFIDNDVQTVSGAFTQAGFDVTPRKGALSSAQIVQAIQTFTAQVRPDERVVLYLSTHGFADPKDSTKGYIVSSDCRTDKAANTCISLSTLEQLVSVAIQNKARHVLVLLDTCSSGLGVVDKRGRYTELAIASHEGAHVMTAGLVDQTAEQDPALRMSTFSFYLAQGLSGKADLTGDGVVSLSELLVYVRYSVATKTNGRQTPMLGRLNGSGEMIFPVNALK